MKILYFHQHFQIPTQAGATRSYEFAKKLIEHGHEVTMICGETAKLDLVPTGKKFVSRGDVDGIDVIQVSLPYSNKDSIAKRAWIFLRFAWFGIGFAMRESYDLLFATSTPLTAGIPGIFAKIFRRKKFIFEVRDLWPELPKALGMKNPFLLLGMNMLEWMSYNLADKCVALSPGIRDGIARRSSLKMPIAMIPNGCDTDLFKPGKRENLKLEGIRQTDIVAIFTGAHGIANGLDAVLDAAAVLKKRKRNDIILVFIGDGKCKEHLQNRAKNESLDNCLFFPPVPKVELKQVVASADIGLMILANISAFYYGTSPNKFFDYISSGLPVLNNYPGFLADIIEKEKCGLVVKPESPEAFADALIKLADNPTMRSEMGQNGRVVAVRDFSRELLANQFVDFLETIS